MLPASLKQGSWNHLYQTLWNVNVQNMGLNKVKKQERKNQTIQSKEEK